MQTESSLEAILQLDWSDYNQSLQQLSAAYQLPNCLRLLNAADELLNQDKSVAQSETVERFLIGGIQDLQTDKYYAFDTQVLGDMTGYASFKKVLKSDPSGFEKLMKIIPKSGPVDGWHYMQFVDDYKSWFMDNGFKQCLVYPVTRLLAMKRPDQFVPLNEQSSERLCQSFSIKPLKKQDFQRYWDDIILTIQKTKWFKAFQPMEAAEIPFHRVRVALLERLAITPLPEIQEEQSIEIGNDIKIEAKTEVENTDTLTVQSSQQTTSEKLQEQPKKVFKQPKKMTIQKRKTAKVNMNAATKLMSQYYFANKETFAKIDIKKHRENIIQRLVDGESVEDIFAEFL